MVRRFRGKLVVDKRKWFTFIHPDGRMVETLAMTREEARKMIEDALGIQLMKEAA